MAAVFEVLSDRLPDLLLHRAHFVVWEGDALGGLTQLLEARHTTFLVIDEPVDLLAQPRVHRFGRPGNLLVSFLVRNDVDQN